VTPIVDCRLPIDSGEIRHNAFSIDNRQSSIGNDSFDFLLPKLRLRVNLKLLKREMKSEENGGCR
jgi:hypothetical protein